MKRVTTTVTSYDAVGGEWLPVSQVVTEVVEQDQPISPGATTTLYITPHIPSGTTWTYPRTSWTI